jgi:hypothetical protein
MSAAARREPSKLSSTLWSYVDDASRLPGGGERPEIDRAPLRYRRLGDGVVIYAVGADRVDNQGTLDEKNPEARGRTSAFGSGKSPEGPRLRRCPAVRVRPAKTTRRARTRSCAPGLWGNRWPFAVWQSQPIATTGVASSKNSPRFLG